jgi:AAHS family 4-hydroxybenzoate transporter-like MFS transporter
MPRQEPTGPGPQYQDILDRSPVSGLQWTAFALCFAVMLLDGFDTAIIGFLAPAISRDWQLERAALTPVFTAGVAGLMLAGCLAGIAADRWGRRPLLMAATLLFAATNLATVFCHGVTELAALRFVTGLGLGAAMPCAVALVSEMAPARRKALIITSLYAGYTVGGALGGWLSSVLVPAQGWRAMFWVGGLVPLALLPAMLLRLPESAAFIAERRRDLAALRTLLSRIAGRDCAVELPPRGERAAASPLRAILTGDRLAPTLLVWLANASGLMMAFAFINWLPSLLSFKQVPLQVAAQSGACFQMGGAAGAVLMGWLMDRFGPGRVTVLAYLAVVPLCLAWALAFGGDHAALLALAFAVGLAVMGGQTGVQVMATQVYAPSMRATGLSWMQSMGRFGGILGIQLTGLGIANGLDAVRLLQALALPALAAALFIAWLARRMAPTGPRTALADSLATPHGCEQAPDAPGKRPQTHRLHRTISLK